MGCTRACAHRCVPRLRHDRSRRGRGAPGGAGGSRRTRAGHREAAGRKRHEHAAAFANPLCRKDAGPYGNLDFVNEGSGPVCVAVVEGGRRQRGRTLSRGHEGLDRRGGARPQRAAACGWPPGTDPGRPRDGADGHGDDAFKDTFAAFEHQAHQTYGRKINLVFVTSSGDDEAAQRADAIAVKAQKPFAVIDGTYTSEPVFGTDLAAAKIPVFANTTSTGSDVEAGSVPLGADRRQRGRDERRRVHGQAACRQESGVRR